jgi:hypothetical protein
MKCGHRYNQSVNHLPSSQLPSKSAVNLSLLLTYQSESATPIHSRLPIDSSQHTTTPISRRRKLVGGVLAQQLQLARHSPKTMSQDAHVLIVPIEGRLVPELDIDTVLRKLIDSSVQLLVALAQTQQSGDVDAVALDELAEADHFSKLGVGAWRG